MEVNTDEFRIKATREKRAREEMAPADREKIESVRDALGPYLHCSHCQLVMLEPWLVKDCGHLFCYNCLDFLVERKVRFLVLVCHAMLHTVKHGTLCIVAHCCEASPREGVAAKPSRESPPNRA